MNLAARLESLNKTLGTGILLSHSVYTHLNGEFVTRRVGKFRVKGRKDATEVYELLGPAAQCPVPDWVELYDTALAAFEAEEYEKARELFVKCDAARIAGDGPSRFFINLLDGEHTTVGGMVDLQEK